MYIVSIRILKFKANDLKGVQVMENSINIQCKSSSHMHSNVHIKLKVVVLIEYTYRKSTDPSLNVIHKK